MKSQAGLLKYFDKSQLTSEFGGTLSYNHHDWVRFRMVRFSLRVCVCVCACVCVCVCVHKPKYSETCIKRPHVGKKKWSLYGGGLLKGAKIYDCCWGMTKWSLKTGGLLVQVVTRTGFTVLPRCQVHNIKQLVFTIVFEFEGVLTSIRYT